MSIRRVARLCLPLLVTVTASAGAFAKFPYLQNLTDSSVVVRWETRSAQPGKVEYGLTPGYGTEVIQTGSAVDHELTLAGLVKDSLYHYRVVSGPDTSADATFQTDVTGDRPFRFLVYGDNVIDSAAHQDVVDRMLAQVPTPGLALNVGGLTHGGSLELYGTFFDIERSLLGRLPMYPSLGNHDATNMANWLRFFALPNNERWYTFHYGNSAFHCVDVYSPYVPGSTQYDWLVSELQLDRADPAIRHIFVFFHEPPYTTNDVYAGNPTVRQCLCPLFERYGVAIAFQGHVHSYEHALVNGVHYIITGGGGAPLHPGWDPPQPWDIYRETTHEFVLVDVDGDTIRARGIRPDGSELDPLVLAPTGVEGETTYGLRVPGSGVEITQALSPTSGIGEFTFTLPTAGHVDAVLYDETGRRVASLVQGTFAKGPNTVSWDGRELEPGAYFLVVASGGRIDVRGLVVVEK